MDGWTFWGVVLIVGSLAWVVIACAVVAIVAVDGRERRHDFYADEEPIPYTLGPAMEARIDTIWPEWEPLERDYRDEMNRDWWSGADS